jgi:Flp pilus assembly protein TadD
MTGHRTIQEKVGVTDQEFQEMGRIGAMFYNQGSLEKAKKIFEGLVELDPENAHAQSALGALLTRTQEDDEKALKHLHQAVELNPQQIAPYVNLGEVLIRQQKLEQAVAHLKKAIELDPDEKDSGANRARAMVLGIYQVLKTEELTKQPVKSEK